MVKKDILTSQETDNNILGHAPKKKKNAATESRLSDYLTNQQIEEILQKYRTCSLYSAQSPIDFKYFLSKIDYGHINEKLTALWSCWDHIFPDSNIHLHAKPLGHKKNILILGCADSIVMQEVRMSNDIILETVNAFLGTQFFKTIKFQLILGEKVLSRSKTISGVCEGSIDYKTNGTNNSYIEEININNNSTDKYNISNSNSAHAEGKFSYIPRLTGRYVKMMEEKDSQNNHRISYVTDAYKKIVAISSACTDRFKSMDKKL